MTGVEFGFAHRQDTVWCARREGVQSRMLCGRKVGFVPVAQPDGVPDLLHDVCRGKIRELGWSV